MKHILANLALSALIATPAIAADMPVKAPPRAVADAAIGGWAGFYVGGHIGASWSDSSFSYVLPSPLGGVPFTSRIAATCAAPTGVAAPPVVTIPNPFGLTTQCRDSRGVLGGLQIGYNVQQGALVYGLEADASWRKRLEDTQFVEFGNNPTAGAPMGSVATDTTYFRSEQSGLGTLRARIGYAGTTAARNWLLYITGGLAVGRVEHQVVEVLAAGTTCVTPSGTTCRVGGSEKTKVGWTAGAGVEFALSNQWSIGAEYLFVDLGDTTITLAPIGGFFTNTSTTTFEDRSHIARVKLNYRWGAGPVVARY